MKRQWLRRLRALRTDLVLLALVIVLGVGVIVPERFSSAIGVDPDSILITLVVIVTIALFYYLRFMMFLLVSVLVVGANLPEHLATQLGINQTALLGTLGALVIVSLVNQLFKLLPTGLEDKHASASSAAPRVLGTAVRRGDLAMVTRLLGMGIDVNTTNDGATPLMVAAEHGYTDLVELLLRHGADPAIRNPAGRTARDVALLRGYTRVAQILHLEPPHSPGGRG